MGRWMMAALLGMLSCASTAKASPRAYELTKERPNPENGWSLDLRRGGSNYVSLNVCDMRDGNCGWNKQGEGSWAKFRIDLEYDIFRKEQRPQRGYWYVTFPIRFLSFWDVFSRSEGAKSAPFIETNYAPGLELTWAATPEVWSWSSRYRLLFTAGVRHESNGLGTTSQNDLEPYSRSWNHGYGAVTLVAGFSESFTLYSRVEAWPLVLWSDPVAAWDNRRLEDYIGYFQVHTEARLQLGGLWNFTFTADVRERSLQLEARWNIKGQRFVKHGADPADNVPACTATDVLALTSQDSGQTSKPRGAAECKDEKRADSEVLEDNFFRLDVFAQCFFGKGERLMVADQRRESCYVGLGF